MKHGFLKAAAASPEMRVADPAYNAEKIIGVISAQAEDDVELLVFPELCISGYTCGDLFLQEALLRGCADALLKIVHSTTGKKMLVFVGLPVSRNGKLYNCAVALCDGEILGFVPKTYLPNYSEFYEQRYFVSGRGEGGTVCFAGNEYPFSSDLLISEKDHPEIKIACEICEDVWAANSPSALSCEKGAVVVVNLSASNETVGKREYRKTLLSAQSGKNLCAYVYADAGTGESTSDMVFSGNNLIYENGGLLAESAPFSGEIAKSEIDVGFLGNERRKTTTFQTSDPDRAFIAASFSNRGDLSLRKIDPHPFVPQGKELELRSELILSMQSNALAKRIAHTQAKTAVIGVSGGLDSALALLVTLRAFDLLKKDRSGIIALMMPGFGTSLKTRNNSNALLQAAGVSMRTVNISGAVNRHFKDIEHDPEVRNSAYENAQARYRTLVLMDVANETGGLVIGTGDLSELALGWCTYNGDHMSMYGVNASIPKTLVKSLVAYEMQRVGGRMEIALKSVLNTEISPELLPPDEEGNISQKTEEIIGPYELTDFYLYCFLRKGYSPAKTLYCAQYAFGEKYDRSVLKKWLVSFYRRFFSQQFKRSCLPDGVKVGSVSLSPRADWRMPSDACGDLWIREAEQLS